MKKIIALFALILFTATVVAQVTGREVKTYYIATETTKLPYNIEPGNLLYVGSTGNTYLAASIAKAGRTPATLKAAATVTLAAVANSSYYVDTANAQNVRGIKTFYSAPATFRGTTNGATNAAFGLSAMNAMTTGQSNTSVGNASLAANTSGSANTAVGHGALGATITGGLNTAVGYASLAANTGTNNTALGYSSLNYNSTGTNNIGIGFNSASTNTTGSYNVAVGPNALFYNSTGTNNIAVGYAAGYYETGSNKLIMSNKVGGADTAIIYGIMGATPAASTLQLNAAVTVANTLTGNALMRGSATFTTTGTRVAVYIPGCATTDYCFVQITATGGTDRPVVGDVCSVYPKTDSLIVQRQAGTTSGLAFDWFRIK